MIKPFNTMIGNLMLCRFLNINGNYFSVVGVTIYKSDIVKYMQVLLNPFDSFMEVVFYYFICNVMTAKSLEGKRIFHVLLVRHVKLFCSFFRYD